MKQHLLTGVAVVATIAISAPSWAQPTPSTAPPPGASAPAPPVQPMNRMPAGGKATSERGATGAAAGMGQPASSASPAPVASGHHAPAQSMNRMPAGGRATSERGATGSVARRHHRHVSHPAKSKSAGPTADQLNRQELSQIQSTNPITTNRMSVGGRPTSGGER
jgi:hypothetical protein